MPRFEEKEVSPLDLQLDPQNPRFIVPTYPTQADIRAYLLKYEGVATLAQDIKDFGGLMPGERIIVCKENDGYVVLEGNRRVCACQLLLDPELIPPGFKNEVPSTNETIQQALSRIRVDVVGTREDADYILATRHIDGIKQWPPLAKMRFFVSRFEAGQTIDQISQKTGISKSNIRTDICQFYLLKSALDLPVWTESERQGPLHWYNMEVTRFTRLFGTKGATAALKLSYDPNTLKPKSELPKEIFEKALELIVKATLVEKITNTRATFNQVPGLKELLESVDSSEEIVVDDDPSALNSQGERRSNQGSPDELPASGESVPTQPLNQVGPSTPSPQSPNTGNDHTEPNDPIVPGPMPQVPCFFEGLDTSSLSNTDQDARGILSIAKEIREISTERLLRKFPNAAAMLLRSLLEQAMKYHLRKAGEWDNLLKSLNGRDPSLEKLIKYYRNHMNDLLPKLEIRRTFIAVFNNEGTKEALDLIVHNTYLSSASPAMLTAIARGGMFALIQALLN